MCRTSLRVMPTVLVCLVVMQLSECRLLAQASQQTHGDEPKLVVSVEYFCSPTKLRTSNARIHWSVSSETMAAARIGTLATARQTLEATVYHEGFEKGLFVSVPVAQATPDRPLAARAPEKVSKLRAYQFSLIQVDQPKAAAATGNEMTAVVEGLEPGVDYTWRIAIETDSGRLLSAPTTTQAVICPADMAGTPSVKKNRRKR
jgi:hypothetical protein